MADSNESIVTSYALTHGVSPDLMLGLFDVESTSNPYAVSTTTSAKGGFQLTDAFAEDYGVTDPFDLGQSADAAARAISKFTEDYGGDERLALVAYNQGPRGLTRFMEQAGSNLWEDVSSVLPDEVITYVDRVLTGKKPEAKQQGKSAPAINDVTPPDKSEAELNSEPLSVFGYLTPEDIAEQDRSEADLDSESVSAFGYLTPEDVKRLDRGNLGSERVSAFGYLTQGEMRNLDPSTYDDFQKDLNDTVGDPEFFGRPYQEKVTALRDIYLGNKQDGSRAWDAKEEPKVQEAYKEAVTNVRQYDDVFVAFTADAISQAAAQKKDVEDLRPLIPPPPDLTRAANAEEAAAVLDQWEGQALTRLKTEYSKEWLESGDIAEDQISRWVDETKQKLQSEEQFPEPTTTDTVAGRGWLVAGSVKPFTREALATLTSATAFLAEKVGAVSPETADNMVRAVRTSKLLTERPELREGKVGYDIFGNFIPLENIASGLGTTAGVVGPALVTGGASLAVNAPRAVAMGGAMLASMGTGARMGYQEGYEQVFAKTQDPSAAIKSAWLNAGVEAIDGAFDVAIARGLIPFLGKAVDAKLKLELVTKLTEMGKLGEVLKTGFGIGGAAVASGVSEVAQESTQAVGTAFITGDESFLPSSEQLITAGLVGALGGIGLGGFSQLSHESREVLRDAGKEAASIMTEAGVSRDRETKLTTPDTTPAVPETVAPVSETTPSEAKPQPEAAEEEKTDVTPREATPAVELPVREEGIAEAPQPSDQITPESLKEPTPLPVEKTEEGASILAGLEIVEYPLEGLEFNPPDLPQFKSEGDERGIVEPLEGKFDRRGLAPIQIYEPDVSEPGRAIVASGRHRADLAQRSGEKSIPAQVLRESEGFTKEDAMIVDAELNIRDEQGSVEDYVNYFKIRGLNEEEAKARGLLSRSKGKQGFAIATKAENRLFDLFKNDKISATNAARIADAAPNDDAIQGQGLEKLFKKDGGGIEGAVNHMHVLQLYPETGRAIQGGLFGDDPSFRQAEVLGNVVTQLQKKTRDALKALKSAKTLSAADRNVLAEAGVKGQTELSDPDAIKRTTARLQQRLLDLSENRWAVSPELRAEVESIAAETLAAKGEQLTLALPSTPKPKEVTPPTLVTTPAPVIEQQPRVSKLGQVAGSRISFLPFTEESTPNPQTGAPGFNFAEVFLPEPGTTRPSEESAGWYAYKYGYSEVTGRQKLAELIRDEEGRPLLFESLELAQAQAQKILDDYSQQSGSSSQQQLTLGLGGVAASQFGTSEVFDKLSQAQEEAMAAGTPELAPLSPEMFEEFKNQEVGQYLRTSNDEQEFFANRWLQGQDLEELARNLVDPEFDSPLAGMPTNTASHIKSKISRYLSDLERAAVDAKDNERALDLRILGTQFFIEYLGERSGLGQALQIGRLNNETLGFGSAEKVIALIEDTINDGKNLTAENQIELVKISAEADKIAQEENEIKDVATAIGATAEEITTLRGEITTRQKNLTTQRAELEAKEKELAKEKRSLKGKDQRLEKLQQQVTELETKFTEEETTLQARKAALREKRQELQKEKTSLKGKLKRQPERRANLEQSHELKMAKLQEQIEALEGPVAEAEAAFQKRKLELDTARKELQREKNSLLGKLKRAPGRLSALEKKQQEKIAALEAQIPPLRQRVEDAERRLSQAKDRFAEQSKKLKRDIADYRKLAKSLDTKKKQLTRKELALQKKRASLREGLIIKSLPAAAQEKIRALAERYEKLRPDSYLRSVLAIEMINVATEAAGGISPLELANTIWYVNATSGLSTQGINAYGSALQLTVKSQNFMARNPSMIGDYLYYLVTRGFTKGAIEAANILTQGRPGRGGIVKFGAGILQMELLTPRSVLESLFTPQPVGIGERLKGAKEAITKSKHPVVEVLTGLGIGKFAARGLSAADTFWYRTAFEAMAGAHIALHAKRFQAMGDVEAATEISNSLYLSGEKGKAALKQAKDEVEIAFGPGNYTQRDIDRAAFEILDQSLPREIFEEGHRWGLESTFNQTPTGVFGTLASGINGLLAKWTINTRWGPVRIGQPFFPFVNIVANVAESGLEFSPFGFVKAAAIDAPRAKKIEIATNAIIGSALATALLSIAWHFSDDDDPPFAIYGSWDPLKKPRKDQLRATGARPFTIKVGNSYIPYKETPLYWLAMFGTYFDNRRWNSKFDEKNSLGVLKLGMLGIGQAFMDQSTLQGIGQIYALSRGERDATDLPASYLSVFLPGGGFAKDLDRIFNQQFQEIVPTVGSEVSTRFLGSFFRNYPIAGETINKPLLNGFGEVVAPTFGERFGLIRRTLGTMRSNKLEPEWEFLAERGLNFSGYSNIVTIGKGRKNQQATIQHIKDIRAETLGRVYTNVLTPEERYNLIKYAGPSIKEAIGQIMINAGDKSRAKLQWEIDTAVAKAKTKAKLRLVRESTFASH